MIPKKELCNLAFWIELLKASEIIFVSQTTRKLIIWLVIKHIFIARNGSLPRFGIENHSCIFNLVNFKLIYQCGTKEYLITAEQKKFQKIKYEWKNQCIDEEGLIKEGMERNKE